MIVTNTLTMLIIVKIIGGGALFNSVIALPQNLMIGFNIITATKVDLAIEKPDLVDFINIASGIFALILSALTLTAYRNLKSKRLLFVSAAFGMFAIHAIVSRLDVFIPQIESSVVELLASTVIFLSLALFFFAIVKKPKIKSNSTTSYRHT